MSTFTRPGKALHFGCFKQQKFVGEKVPPMGETFGAEVTFEVMEWQELMRVEVESHDAIVVKDLSDLSDLLGWWLKFYKPWISYGLRTRILWNIWLVVSNMFYFPFHIWDNPISQARDASSWHLGDIGDLRDKLYLSGWWWLEPWNFEWLSIQLGME